MEGFCARVQEKTRRAARLGRFPFVPARDELGPFRICLATKARAADPFAARRHHTGSATAASRSGPSKTEDVTSLRPNSRSASRPATAWSIVTSRAGRSTAGTPVMQRHARWACVAHTLYKEPGVTLRRSTEVRVRRPAPIRGRVGWTACRARSAGVEAPPPRHRACCFCGWCSSRAGTSRLRGPGRRNRRRHVLEGTAGLRPIAKFARPPAANTVAFESEGRDGARRNPQQSVGAVEVTVDAAPPLRTRFSDHGPHGGELAGRHGARSADFAADRYGSCAMRRLAIGHHQGSESEKLRDDDVRAENVLYELGVVPLRDSRWSAPTELRSGGSITPAWQPDRFEPACGRSSPAQVARPNLPADSYLTRCRCARRLPVLHCNSKALSGEDSLLSISPDAGRSPTAHFAIGVAGRHQRGALRLPNAGRSTKRRARKPRRSARRADRKRWDPRWTVVTRVGFSAAGSCA